MKENFKHACVIAAGVVVIEDGKVLLMKDIGPDGFWKFPGGKIEEGDASFEATAARETKEELGFDVEIIRPVKPMLVKLPIDGQVILIHYLAKRLGDVQPGEETREWAWHPIDALPPDLAPNIRPVLEEAKNA